MTNNKLRIALSTLLIIGFVFILGPLAFAQCEPVRIMPLGDSITDEYNVDGSYRKDLYDLLEAAGYTPDIVDPTAIPRFDFVGGEDDGALADPDHEGHSGFDAHEIRDNIYAWLVAKPAEIVLLHIGTNDINGGQSAAGVAAEIGEILDNIDTYSPDVWVILARIVNRQNPTDTKGLETTELNNQIQILADARIDDKIIVVDMESALTYPGDMADTLHPNESGYGEMAGVWFNALDNFLPGYCSDGPAIVNLSLTSTSGGNLPTDDLTCGYDLAGGATTAATAWHLGGLPAMRLYLPMEGGESNALLDFSGNSVGVTKSGTPTWSSTAGHDGNGAFVFDNDGYLDAGDNFPTSSPYTKTAWIRLTAYSSNNIISGSVNSTGHAFWTRYGSNDTLSAGHHQDWYFVKDTNPLSLDTWYFVAVTFDYDTGEMILYRDGIPVDSGFVPEDDRDVTDATLLIGAFANSNLMRGTIDDARVYSHVLSPEQITAMYNGGSGNNNEIVSQETAAGDAWQCEVTSFSDSEMGVAQSSNTLNIVGADDTDGDGIPDTIEDGSGTCLSPTDDDSDDDGILDGNEDLNRNGVWEEAEGETNFCDADTDDDLILDGTEIGLASPQGSDTDPAVFVADLDPATTTDPLDDDSDDDGLLDGEEDANQNGRLDDGETDPQSGPGDPTINNLALSSTSGNNLPTDDLTCGYDLAGSATTAATAWYKDTAPQMVLYMPMEGGETNGLKDYSGNDVPITTGDTPTWSSTAGHDGNGAFEFDGNDVLDAGAVFPTLSSYSQTAWVQKTADDSWQNIVSGTKYEHLLLANNGYLKCGHNELISLEDTVPLTNGEWYHVAVTFDYDSGELILYKNGSPIDSKIVTTKDMTNGQLYIGRFGDGKSWRGVIDDARVYAHVLSPDQIAAMYNGGSGNNNEIVSQETAAGDDWQCEVTPFSDSEMGATQSSNTLNIVAVPTVENLDLTSTSGNNLDSDDLTCGYDLAGSATTAATAWYKDTDPQMVLYMPMEGGETNGLKDYSGNDVPITTGDTPTWSSTAGHDGNGAFEFDGNDVLDAGAVFPTLSSYSQTAWVQKTADDSWQNIVSGTKYEHLLLANNGYLKCGHNELISLEDTVPLTNGEWYHVAVTFDYDSGELILYKNGSPIDSKIVTTKDMTNGQLYIGRFGDGKSWRGVIDDARVYAHVLSPEQIAAMYNGGSGNNNEIVSQETAAGDAWQCEVTSFSDSEMGVAQSSNTLNIVGADDTDGDGIPDTIEDGSGTCLSPTDDDSDDDGILDGNEDLNRNGVWEEAEGETNFCDADTDDDLILDGTEIGLASPQGSDTDPAVFVADLDPATTTDPLDDDSDGDGELDGEEDANQNGRVDAGETDPLSGPGDPTINNLALSSTSGGNLPTDDLTCGYNLTGTSTTAATAWYIGGSSQMALYLPMEGGASNALLDFSGNGVGVTADGTPTWLATGGHDGNGAFDFDNDGYLDAGENFPTSSSYTKTAWIRLTAYSSNNIISGDTNGGGHALWTRNENNDTLSAGHNGTWTYVKDTSPLSLNTWYFVAVTFDYESGEMILYRNGNPVDFGSVPENARDVTDATLLIGAFNGGYLMRGTIDDARVYAHVLSPEQIAAMYNGGSGNNNEIVSQETADGDQWQCEVTPFSDSEMGATQSSNTLTIVTANDTDGDGIPDDIEDTSGTCLNSADDDSDDDGILDGNEDLNQNGIWEEAEGETNFCDADTDDDLILDGTEIGLTAPQGSGTDLGVFVADADGGTTTNPLKPDTDGDGVDDGVEDANQNGAVDDGETDPLSGPSPCAPLTIMPLGDSITYGSDGTYGGYRGYLYDKLTEEPDGYNVNFVGSETGNSPGLADPDHEGHGGWTADQIAANIYNGLDDSNSGENWLQMAADNPDQGQIDIILLHIGTNDISDSQSISDITDEIGDILDEIDQYEIADGVEIWVILARIINRDDSNASDTTALNNAIQILADARIAAGDKIIVVDMESALTYPDHLDDSVHPNDSGYALMAGVWEAALNNFLPGYCSDGPAIANLSLTSTSGSNLPTDDLTCGFDLAGTSTTAATAWYKDGAPLMNLYLPMEGNEINALLDHSGNGYDGTKGLAVSWDATGGQDTFGAFAFDGSADSYIDMGSAMPSGAYTKTAWVYTPGGGCRNIISGDYSNALWVTEGYLQAGHNGGWTEHVRDSNPFPVDSWVFVAVTYDPNVASGQMILYRDGGVVASNTSVPLHECATCTDPNQLWVGAFSRSNDGQGPHCNWNGRIDDARVYAHVLSPEQIATMYNSGAGDTRTIVSQQTQASDEWQ